MPWGLVEAQNHYPESLNQQSRALVLRPGRFHNLVSSGSRCVQSQADDVRHLPSCGPSRSIRPAQRNRRVVLTKERISRNGARSASAAATGALSRSAKEFVMQAVLWDMDGVLIDSESLWTVAKVELAGQYGREWT